METKEGRRRTLGAQEGSLLLDADLQKLSTDAEPVAGGQHGLFAVVQAQEGAAAAPQVAQKCAAALEGKLGVALGNQAVVGKTHVAPGAADDETRGGADDAAASEAVGIEFLDAHERLLLGGAVQAAVGLGGDRAQVAQVMAGDAEQGAGLDGPLSADAQIDAAGRGQRFDEETAAADGKNRVGIADGRVGLEIEPVHHAADGEAAALRHHEGPAGLLAEENEQGVAGAVADAGGGRELVRVHEGSFGVAAAPVSLGRGAEDGEPQAEGGAAHIRLPTVKREKTKAPSAPQTRPTAAPAKT